MELDLNAISKNHRSFFRGREKLTNKETKVLSSMLLEQTFGHHSEEAEKIADFCCSEQEVMMSLTSEQRDLMVKMKADLCREADLVPRRSSMAVFSDTVSAMEKEVLRSVGS